MIPADERRKIIEERNNYSNKRQKISAVQYVASVPPAISVNQDHQDTASMAGSTVASVNSRNPNVSNASNNHHGMTMMGGRNEQASLRSRNSNNN